MSEYPRECQECDSEITQEMVEEGRVTICNTCDKIYCEDCQDENTDICHDCGGEFCNECMAECRHCGNFFCDDCVEDISERDYFAGDDSEPYYVCDMCNDEIKDSGNI